MYYDVFYILMCFLLLYGVSALILYAIMQFCVNAKDNKDKTGNFIVKIVAIAWIYIRFKGGTYKGLWHNVSCFIEIYQNKTVLLLSALGIVALEAGIIAIWNADRRKKTFIYRYALARRIFLSLQLISTSLAVIHLLFMSFNMVSVNKSIWYIELGANLVFLLCYVFVSSFNITIGNDKKYVCVNNGLSQVLLVSDEHHPYTFSKNSEDSYVISSGDESGTLFALDEDQISKLEEMFNGRINYSKEQKVQLIGKRGKLQMVIKLILKSLVELGLALLCWKMGNNIFSIIIVVASIAETVFICLMMKKRKEQGDSERKCDKADEKKSI